ncbi:hypothetical protein BRADI_1g46747v3 [Brachypodium distachyon]|uniref:Uncharacterized protein n=1 Tax=Brachypodium distachyon TaxID=15368 RepID=A0A2K2DPT5_BRADI|nr:hypothetical protein BRADI_1g46747v3 [Brachypodium distachyon]
MARARPASRLGPGGGGVAPACVGGVAGPPRRSPFSGRDGDSTTGATTTTTTWSIPHPTARCDDGDLLDLTLLVKATVFCSRATAPRRRQPGPYALNGCCCVLDLDACCFAEPVVALNSEIDMEILAPYQ